jgi:processive 1,2-diacylglycerol beta-glucosyltransferase
MQRFIADYNPDAIVCTHATPAGLVAYLRKNGIITTPVLAVVTDFVVHRLWIYPEIDFYYVAHSSLQDYLNDNGVPYDRSLASGIPVDASFALPRTKETIMAELNLKPSLPVILVMGGGAGVLPMDEILSVCQQFSENLQVVAVTGHNHKLYKKLTAKYKQVDHVHILGYVNIIPELMAVSSVIISKPGGMTSAEALCAGLPMIIYRPIPGQEEGNARHLASQQVAGQVDSLSELSQAITQLLEDESDFLDMRRHRALSLSRPNAASDIAQHIIKFIQNGQAQS